MRRRRRGHHLRCKGGRGGTPFRRRPPTGSGSRLGTPEGGREEGGRRLRDQGRGKGRRVQGGGKRRTHPDHLPCDDKVRTSTRRAWSYVAPARPWERRCLDSYAVSSSSLHALKRLLSRNSCCGFHGDSRFRVQVRPTGHTSPSSALELLTNKSFWWLRRETGFCLTSKPSLRGIEAFKRPQQGSLSPGGIGSICLGYKTATFS